MARTNKRRRYYRSKGRWASNIQSLNLSGSASESSRFGDSFTIAQNPGQSNSSVAQTYTVKNIEISAQLEVGDSTPAPIEDISYYIMYVPEGYPISIDLPYNHPEWIMAYKYIGQTFGNTQSSTYQPPKIKTRLARKLNTGDSIIFLYNGLNSSNNPHQVRLLGLVRWWTKAN